uniref:Uncharacterized protein n=1 Tax=Strigamia maritima TaxID=126957 RepID=T1JHP6_STRMM
TISSPCLPRRPLIHCHQRSSHSDTHRLIRDVAKQNRRPITPPWSSILKEGLSGVHEDLLISYYNTTSKAVDGMRRYNRQPVLSQGEFYLHKIDENFLVQQGFSITVFPFFLWHAR